MVSFFIWLTGTEIQVLNLPQIQKWKYMPWAAEAIVKRDKGVIEEETVWTEATAEGNATKGVIGDVASSDGHQLDHFSSYPQVVASRFWRKDVRYFTC